MTRRAPSRLEVIAANVGGRRPVVVADVLEPFIDERDPDIVVLVEARGWKMRRELRRRFRAYRLKRARTLRPESDNQIALVRRDIGPLVVRSLKMRTRWIGPKHKRPHAGRTHPFIDIGDRWRIWLIHRVPGGPQGGVSPALRGANKQAWDEEDERLETSASWPESRRRANVWVGDQNCEDDDRHVDGVPSLAARIRAEVIPTGAKVDWTYVTGCDGRGRVIAKPGQFDHPIVGYAFHHLSPTPKENS